MTYQPDVAAALQQARQEAYDRGGGYRQERNEQARSMSEEEYAAWETAIMRSGIVEAFGDDAWEPADDLSRLAWHAAQIEVTDPDTLLNSQPFSGTHSIIDMTGVAAESTAHHVAPVSDADLTTMFGTHRPSTAAVAEAIEHRTLSGEERWHGRYVVAYDDDAPAAIFFVGYSGD